MLLSRGGIVEEDGRRWTKKKVQKSKKKKKRSIFFGLESAGDGLGTLVGVQIAQKIFWALGYDFFEKNCFCNLTVVLRIDSYESN